MLYTKFLRGPFQTTFKSLQSSNIAKRNGLIQDGLSWSVLQNHLAETHKPNKISIIGFETNESYLELTPEEVTEHLASKGLKWCPWGILSDQVDEMLRRSTKNLLFRTVFKNGSDDEWYSFDARKRHFASEPASQNKINL
jgi:hypothetical protein